MKYLFDNVPQTWHAFAFDQIGWMSDKIHIFGFEYRGRDRWSSRETIFSRIETSVTILHIDIIIN